MHTDQRPPGIKNAVTIESRYTVRRAGWPLTAINQENYNRHRQTFVIASCLDVLVFIMSRKCCSFLSNFYFYRRLFSLPPTQDFHTAFPSALKTYFKNRFCSLFFKFHFTDLLFVIHSQY